MNSRNILVLSYEYEAPQQPDKQNIDEQELMRPRIMRELISTENKFPRWYDTRDQALHLLADIVIRTPQQLHEMGHSACVHHSLQDVV